MILNPEHAPVRVRDVTDLLGVPTSTIRRWIAEGIVQRDDDTGMVSWWDCVEAASRPMSTATRRTVNADQTNSQRSPN